MPNRRLCLAALAAVAAASGLPARAQAAYPTKPIRLLVPFSAGGSPDLLARLVATQLSRQMGQSVLVDNRLGANGIIASEAAANAAPDGYTLLLTTGSHSINPSIYKKLPYDTATAFAPVTQLIVAPALVLVVSPQFPAKTIAEFLAIAHRPDGNVSFGSPGIGNTLHMAGELLNVSAGTKMLHVPYKGAAPALAAVMGGEVSACFLSTTAATIAINSGQVRPLAVTSAQRIASLPNVPTLAESGVPGFDYDGGWTGILAPAKTPRPIVDKLSAEIRQALQVPAVRDQLLAWDSVAIGSTPDAFATFLQDDAKKYAAIVRQANVPMQ
ncbi:tripartite tricarboxylate transporter substrate binding protein [uncultured Xylophilus sp.]|uniref:tripartite tricarboxylate transporter substrate binding protein n=1 Tax=uncultured Xylophilus sp. TaxID=296832 RepID=UPI0025EFD76D|nr:tripartite tricarboxylate transporter substrate binding protein [uncultured Xylophilus sp.]